MTSLSVPARTNVSAGTLRRFGEALACMALRPRAVPPVRDFPLLDLASVTTSYGKIDCLLERGRVDWERLSNMGERSGMGMVECAILVLITNLPPNANPDDTATSIASRAAAREWAQRYPGLHQRARLPLKDIRDESSHPRDTDLLVCVPEPGTTAEQLRDQLMDVYGVCTEVHVALPRPLATMIREWAEAYRSEDLPASLTALENAIRIQSDRG